MKNLVEGVLLFVEVIICAYTIHKLIWYNKFHLAGFSFIILFIHIINLIITKHPSLGYTDYLCLNNIGIKMLKSSFISYLIVLYIIILFFSAIFIFIVNRRRVFNLKNLNFFEEGGFWIFNTFIYYFECGFLMHWISLIIKEHSSFPVNKEHSIIKYIIIILMFIFCYVTRNIIDNFFEPEMDLEQWTSPLSLDYSEFKSNIVITWLFFCLYLYISFFIYNIIILIACV